MQRIRRTSKEKIEILNKSNGKCAHCGISIDEHSMTIDHFYPLYKGGDDEINNIVALCKDCNRNKANYVYEPADYYTFLNPEHIEYLNEYLEDKYYKKGYPLGNVTKVLHIADKSAHNVIMSKSSKEECLFFRNKCMKKLILEQAYPAESEEILKFIIKAKNYRRKQNAGKNYHKFEPDNKWLAIRTIENCILRDKLYTLSSTATKEYYGYFLFNRIKDMEIIEDTDNIYNNIKNEFFISAYDTYKFPVIATEFFHMVGQYCKANETFIPILEVAPPNEYTALTQMNSYLKEKYSFIKVEYINTPDPIPKDKEGSPVNKYSEGLIYFFRVPKFYLFGQPMTESIYIDVIKEIKECEHSSTR